MENYTDEKLAELIALATGAINRDPDIWSKRPDYACRGWVTYVGLQPGSNRICASSLWEAACAFFEKKGVPLPEEDLFYEELSKKLPSEAMAFEDVYLVNKKLPAVWHLSTPNKRAWHGLNRKTMPKNVQDFVDQDYVHKLSERDKLFLSKFNDEFYNARFLNDATDLHNEREEKRERYRNSNAMNRDVQGIMGSKCGLVGAVEKKEYGDIGYLGIQFDIYQETPGSNEDVLINFIDAKTIIKNSLAELQDKLWEHVEEEEV